MKRTAIYFSILALIISVGVIKAQDIEVTLAGSSNINGTYTYIGQNDSYDYFTRDGSSPTMYLYYNDSPERWIFGLTLDGGSGSTGIYRTATTTVTSPIGLTFLNNTDNPGILPVPTVAAYVAAVPAIPVADFSGSPLSGTPPLTVNFTDLSTGVPDIWLWDFSVGDGWLDISTSKNPRHIYAVAGTYTVRLDVTTTGYGAAYEEKTDYITVACVDAPTLYLYAYDRDDDDDYCRWNISETLDLSPGGADLPLSDTYYYINGYDSDCSSNTPNGYTLDTDGPLGSGSNPSITATAGVSAVVTGAGLDAVNGTYSYTGTNGNGNEYYTKTGATAAPAPVADFTYTGTTGPIPHTVTFTDASTNTPTYWLWDFGDPASGVLDTSTLENPSHTYNDIDSYTVTLTAGHLCGSDDVTKTDLIDAQVPVELSAFTVEATLTGVLLGWTTESEIENLGFILERRTEGTDWTEIASYKTDDGLLGQGSISSATDYEYLDALVEPNTTYEYRLGDVDYNGLVTYHATREVSVEMAPLASVVERFTVLPAYPNPFNPITTIRYGLDDVSNVTIQIYDISGKLITTLLNTEQAQGWHSVIWNGTNQHSKQVPAGIYFSRIDSGSEVKTIKVMLLK